MDKTVPAGAAYLLDFIASKEAPEGYGTVYGNSQGKLAKPLVAMTLAEVIAAGSSWTKRFGSSACGRYQFMKATLQDLRGSAPPVAEQPIAAAKPPSPPASVPGVSSPAPSGGLLRSGAQATGGAVRSGLSGLWNAIHTALARKA